MPPSLVAELREAGLGIMSVGLALGIAWLRLLLLGLGPAVWILECIYFWLGLF
jgi:hypothetical protein